MSTTSSATLRDYASLIKLSHSVFALPFALIALLVASGGAPGLDTVVWVVVAMVCARTAAMAYNRYADRELDARNPRTAGREIPRGTVSARAALGLTVTSSAGFAGACAMLGPACLLLAGPVLAVLLGYSHAKRFTSLSHVWLGLALGLSPLGAWLAVRGVFDAELLVAAVLGLGVTLWVAGFDVLYACQDDEFDRAVGLHSLPARLGRPAALRVARLSHVLAIGAFAGFGAAAGLGWIWFTGVGAAAVLLAVEQRLIAPDDLDRIDVAFFTMNGLVGLLLLGSAAGDLYLG